MIIYVGVVLAYLAYLTAGLLAIASALSFSHQEWQAINWNRTIMVACIAASMMLWLVPVPIPFYWAWIHPRLRRAQRRAPRARSTRERST